MYKKPESIISIMIAMIVVITSLCVTYMYSYAADNDLPYWLATEKYKTEYTEYPTGERTTTAKEYNTEETISGKVGSKLIWSIDRKTQTLTIDNKGAMISFAAESAPWLNYKQYIRTVIINDGCTNVSERAFYSCSYIVSVYLPDSIKNIDDYAFYNCYSLKDIIIPDNVTKLGTYAFYSCYSLENITIPENMEIIDYGAFNRCTNLKNVSLGNCIKTIQTYVFQDCSSLESIIIPDNVESIYYGAFNGCTNLTNVTVGKGVKLIESSAFTNCSKLSKIAIYSKNCTIAKNAISIYSTIYGYTGSTAETFANTYGYEFVSIDASCEHAYSNDCDTSCNLCGETRTTSHNYGEWTVTKEPTCTSTGTKQRICSAGGCVEKAAIEIVPHTDVNDDGICEVCKTQFEIKYTMHGVCGPDLTWTLDTKTGVLDITGTGTMTDFAFDIIIGPSVTGELRPWGYYSDYIKTVNIASGVTTIGTHAFNWCSNLTSVTIPNSVTSIGAHAFMNCESLADIRIGNGVTYIGDYAFAQCSSLNSVSFPDKPIYISRTAFESSYNVSIRCKSGSYAYDWAIQNNKSVIVEDGSAGTAFKIKNRVLTDYAGTASNVVLPADISSVGYGAFESNATVKLIEIPYCVSSIYSRAFANCPNLESVIIPFTVTDIADSAFEGTDATIYCYYNSYAYNYAVKNALKYELITVTLSTNNVNMNSGDSITVNAIPSVTVASGIPIVWKSSNADIVSVDSTGKLIANGVGNAIVGVYSFDGTLFDECSVTVSEPVDEFENVEIKFEPVSTGTLKYGEKILLHINVANLPEGASIKWATSNGAVLRISNESAVCSNHEGCVTCTVESVGNGSAEITGTVVDENGEPVLRDSEEIKASYTMNSKGGFFWKIIAFFKKLFGLLKTISQ